MFLTVVLLSIALVAMAIIGLGVSIIFKKNGKFPDTAVGHNPEMRKLGLSCARTEEIKSFQLQRNINATKAKSSDLTMESSGCSGCSCSAD